MIAIVDVGIGNTGSLLNMFRKLGAPARLVTGPQGVLDADRVVLPGVGAFERGVTRLDEAGVRDSLVEFANSGRPILGICLGMQLLTRGSEEGGGRGLDLVPADTVRLEARAESGLKIPHMGWNRAKPSRQHRLFDGLCDDARFYFVHSYHVRCDDDGHVVARTEYGQPFVSSVAIDNVMGVQFHPEKSHSFGLKLLRNFVAVD